MRRGAGCGDSKRAVSRLQASPQLRQLHPKHISDFPHLVQSPTSQPVQPPIPTQYMPINAAAEAPETCMYTRAQTRTSKLRLLPT